MMDLLNARVGDFCDMPYIEIQCQLVCMQIALSMDSPVCLLRVIIIYKSNIHKIFFRSGALKIFEDLC